MDRSWTGQGKGEGYSGPGGVKVLIRLDGEGMAVLRSRWHQLSYRARWEGRLAPRGHPASLMWYWLSFIDSFNYLAEHLLRSGTGACPEASQMNMTCPKPLGNSQSSGRRGQESHHPLLHEMNATRPEIGRNRSSDGWVWTKDSDEVAIRLRLKDGWQCRKWTKAGREVEAATLGMPGVCKHHKEA